MTTETAEQPVALVKYDVTNAAIKKMRLAYEGLQCEGSSGYEVVKLAIADVRGVRGRVEKRRIELKADALAFGRRVDEEAKRITTLLREIEDPLKARKEVVDGEKERAKQAKREEAEAKMRAELEAQEARLVALRKAEEARLVEERAALAAQRAALEAEQRKATELREAEEAKLREREQALQDERQAVADAKAQVDRIEFEHQAIIRAEQEAKDKLERERLEAVEREARLEALKPDRLRVFAFALAIRGLRPPEVTSTPIETMLVRATRELIDVATNLEEAMEALV